MFYCCCIYTCYFFRGCGGLKISVGLASAACTDDIRMAVELVVKRYPESPLFTVGFSLGANILVKYLAEVRNTFLSAFALAVGSLPTYLSIDLECYCLLLRKHAQVMFAL